MNNNVKGFTLIELLVVVLIIGILASMALPQYFKAVERARMTEAVTLLGNIAQAQQRKWLQVNRFAGKPSGLDVAPQGTTHEYFFTKGDVNDGSNGNGFKVTLGATTDDYTAGRAEAERELNGADTNLQYKYKLARYYGSTDVACMPLNDNAQGLCADFCGVDEVATNAWCCNSKDTAEDCDAPDAIQ